MGPEVVNKYNGLNYKFPFLFPGKRLLNRGNDPCKPRIPHSLACLSDTYALESLNKYGHRIGESLAADL